MMNAAEVARVRARTWVAFELDRRYDSCCGEPSPTAPDVAMSNNVDSATAQSIEYRGETKPRSRLLAVVLAFLCPGLAYMYVGKVLRGVTTNLLFLLLLVSFIAVFGALKFFPLLPLAVLALAWLVFGAFVAQGALRLIAGERPYVLRSYNHWTLYCVMSLVTFALPIYGAFQFVSRYLAGLQAMRTAAMYPTIHEEEVALVDLSAFRNRTPKRGDVVALTPQGRSGEPLILRVVAVENDVVRIEGETVFVNNEPLERAELESQDRVPTLEGEGDLLALVERNNGNSYVISVSPKAFSAHSMAPKKLAPQQLFVLADNRSQVSPNSPYRIRDSRDFGPISTTDVRGEPLYIAWSPAWDRIGLRTQ